MNRHFILFIVYILAGTLLTGCLWEPEETGAEQHNESTFTNPVWSGADPWMVKKDGWYYYCFKADNAIKVSRSRLMTERQEIRTVWTAPDFDWNQSHIWAPELHFIQGRWYIYYAAGRAGPPFIHQRSGVLQSIGQDVFGDYTDMGMLYTSDRPEDSTAVWAIDVTILRHEDSLYAVWSGWEQNQPDDSTPQHLYIAPMENPHTLAGPRVKISSPEEAWETGGPLDLNEAPQVLKTASDLFIIYSCRESWLREYRLGQLQLKSMESDPMDPGSWIKSGPVFQGTSEVYGTGHASFVTSPDGTEDWIVYHSKKTTEPGWDRDIRMQEFHWNPDGSPDFGVPDPAGVPIERPAGEMAIDTQSESRDP